MPKTRRRTSSDKLNRLNKKHRRYTRKWTDILRLGGWRIGWAYHNENNVLGSADVALDKRTAQLTILPEKKIPVCGDEESIHNIDQKNVELTILHELLHVFLFPLKSHAKKKRINEYQDDEEQIINTLSYILYDLQSKQDQTTEEPVDSDPTDGHTDGHTDDKEGSTLYITFTPEKKYRRNTLHKSVSIVSGREEA